MQGLIHSSHEKMKNYIQSKESTTFKVSKVLNI